MSFVPTDWPCPTSWEDIATAFAKTCHTGRYPMELVGEDAQLAVEVWDQGIDARLEAIHAPSTAVWVTKTFTRKLVLRLDLPGLLVFLRRLWEKGQDGDLAAEQLYNVVLGTLGLKVGE